MNKFGVLIIAATLAALFSCKKESHSAYSSVLSFRPDSVSGKDAFVEDYPFEDYQNRNWGKSKEFIAAAWSSGAPYIVRSFIDFDFNTLPEHAVIDSARLSLYAYGIVGGHGIGHDTLSGTNECFIQRVTGNWQEDLVTWNNQPTTTELNQIQLPKSSFFMQDYTAINVTNLVRDIYKNRTASHGFMLRLKYEDGYRTMIFASSDVKESEKRPKLDIYYTVK